METSGVYSLTDSSVAALLIKQERALHSGNVRADAAALDALLAPEFQEFGASGTVYNKAQIVAELVDDPQLEVSVSAEHVRELSADVMLLTYKCVSGASGTRRTSIRSSIWKKMDGRWRMCFHQGTIVPDREA